MARYERDYGRDFGGWTGRGGKRPDSWGSGNLWRGGFPGDESWIGGPEGFSPDYADRNYRSEQGYGGGYGGYPGSSGQGRFAGYGRGPGYGEDYGAGRGRDIGNPAREGGYMEGWQDHPGGMGQGSGRQDGSGWARPRAGEIMTENPHVVTPDASIADVARKMRDLDVGIIPVVEDMEGRRLRGVITDRDITIRAVAEGRSDGRVSDCMTDRVRSVNKNDSIQDVMWVMRREQVRRVPVTDREGRLVGIIAQADLAVDYAADDRGRETEVGETIERISEPARPERPRMAAGSTSTQNKSGGKSGKGGSGSGRNPRGG